MTEKRHSRQRKFPVGHTLMGLSGWALYAWAAYASEAYTPLLYLAIFLTVLAIPRFVRGSPEDAERRALLQLEKPPEPSKRVMTRMTSSETLRLETTDHPIRLLWWYVGQFALTALGSLAIGYFDGTGTWIIWITLIIWSIGALIIFCKAFLWRKDKLCITDKRIFVVRGYFKIRHEFMPLSKLATAKIQVPWHSTILSWLRLIELPYGTLVADAAGEEDELKKNDFIPRINQVSHMLNTD